MFSIISSLIAPQQDCPIYSAQWPKLHEPDFVHYLRDSMSEGGLVVERFHAIFLDDHRDYLTDRSLGNGKQYSISIRLRELFGAALACGARSLLVAHSHPSGVCRPSQRDVAETTRLMEVGKALDIELLDHVIITRHAAYSMRMGEEL